jgi:hypothetical protein
MKQTLILVLQCVIAFIGISGCVSPKHEEMELFGSLGAAAENPSNTDTNKQGVPIDSGAENKSLSYP